MPTTHVINVDLADVFKAPDRKDFIMTLGWGEEVEVVAQTPAHVEIKLTRFDEQPDGSIKPVETRGFIEPTASSRISASDVVIDKGQNRVLKVDFVDVQQGDGMAIETPKGRVILMDGGDNQLFARYLASRHRHSSDAQPKAIDCIVVSHGDADHFSGLAEIHASEANDNRQKRIFIAPQRVYHNGLVKRPSSVPEIESLGATVTVGDETIITGLETDLLAVSDAQMNTPFRAWKRALKAFQKRGPITFRRLSQGDDDAFDFLADEPFQIEVLGPILTQAGGVSGLKFLGEPKKGPRIGHESTQPDEAQFSGKSASHTINGHSVILKLTYGGFSFLFAGDLNEESERSLVREHDAGRLNLRSEILKVPHHGSSDFTPGFLQAVSPMISIVSSGDESARKEYIHPRATLMGALGRSSRVTEPLIFVTELVAFFQVEGFIDPWHHQIKPDPPLSDAQRRKKGLIDPAKRGRFFAFSRAAFGLVRVRTDGQRLVVSTSSGQARLREAYAFEIQAAGEPVPVAVRKA
jgi:beta-lactamase superfamily II metal-dependent hydrolase